MLKQCKQCSRVAQYSLMCTLTTVGVAKRVQEFSRVILLCNDCLGDCMHDLRSSEHLSTLALHECVNSVLTAVQLALQERMSAETSSQST